MMKFIFYVFILTIFSLSANAQWATDGNAICNAPNNQSVVQSVSDGKGGAIIVWQDNRTDAGDIYAQRVTAGGQSLWTANGVVVCKFDSAQTAPTIASDGAGGVIVAWTDARNNTSGGQMAIPNFDIYAQHLDSTGAQMWTPASGVAVCTDPGAQGGQAITSDGAGGAVVGWDDLRKTVSFAAIDVDIYAQRISNAGLPMWTPNGIAVADGPKYQGTFTAGPVVCNDNTNYYFFWPDTRNDTTAGFQQPRQIDIYGQMVNSAGLTQWTPISQSAVSLTNVYGNKTGFHAIPDGTGGAIVSWSDSRSIPESDIYAQRVNVSGAVQWHVNGIAVNAASGNQTTPVMVSDGKNGAIIAWLDSRDGQRNVNIYGQRITSAGVELWNSNGVPISTSDSSKSTLAIEKDGTGGVYVAWRDRRHQPADVGDIYAARFDSTGNNLWNNNGNPLCLAAGTQLNPSITSTPSGAIISFLDQAIMGDANVRANFIDASGNAHVTVGVSTSGTIANTFSLSQNYPNPVSKTTSVYFTIATTGRVTLDVFDILGNRVATPLRSTIDAGEHSVILDATSLVTGAYMYRLSTPEGTITQMMIVKK